MANTTLHFKMFGAGDPIIILHGFLGALDNWQTFAKKLAENYLVIIVDQRNHGKSFHSEDFSYDLMAEDLKHLMDQEWIHEATIIGHSMGGKTAMHFAMLYPDMVEKLVVVDIAPKLYEAGHHAILEALNAVPIDTVQTRQEVDDILSQYIDDIGVRLFLMKNLGRKEKGYRWKANLAVLTRAYDQILQRIEGTVFEHPTLFVRGEKSNYIRDEDMTYIEELFPAARLVTIADAGHWVHAEQPSALLEQINSFIIE